MLYITRHESGMKAILQFVAYVVMFFYPLTMFIYKGIRTEYLGILFLLFLAALLLKSFRATLMQFDFSEKKLLTAYVLFFFIAFVSYVFMGVAEVANKRLAIYSFFLIAPCIYILFRFIELRVDLIWGAVALGCCVAFGRAVLEELGLVRELAWVSQLHRANGVMHPIRFGDLTLLMGFISLAGAIYLYKLSSFVRYFGVLAGCLGIIASFMSQTRGAWVAMPFMVLVLLLPKYKRMGKAGRNKVLLSIFSLFLLVFIFSGEQMLIRVKQAQNDVSSYIKGKSGGPIGVRFDMAETALNIAYEHPLWGVGIGNYHRFSVNYYNRDDSGIAREVIVWKNPHNEFLLQLSTRGIIGLIAILLLFYWSFMFFYRNRKDQENGYQFSAIAGMLVITGYFFFGMSIALFEHRDFSLFFIIYTMFFAATLTEKNN